MQGENSFDGVFSVIKGALVALGCSLFLSVVFACLLRVFQWSSEIIYPVNQVLKVVSVAAGTLLFTRGEKGWLKGGVIGLSFTMLSYLAFSAIGGDYSLSWLVLLEIFVGAFSGALCGILAVNIWGR